MTCSQLHHHTKLIRIFFQYLILLTAAFSVVFGQSPKSAKDLVGLWEAKRIFGPDVRGTLVIKQRKDGWSAEISGYFVQVTVNDDTLSFELPKNSGSFHGNFESNRSRIIGYWIQAGAFPVTLTKNKSGAWQGEVTPYQDQVRCYLVIKARNDGTIGVTLRNPERNFGFTQYRFDYLERDGTSAKFFTAKKDGQPGEMLAEGRYDAENDVLSVYLPNRGGTYDFSRVPANADCDVYPRGHPGVKYIYSPPQKRNDGWETSTLESVGISRDSIEKFIQVVVDTPFDSIDSQEDHGIIIARHGKIVLEEYFHGEYADKAHDTRSAGKSVASDMMGAAILSGVELTDKDSVYKIMNGGEFPQNLDPRKKAMTVAHLLTMSSGFDCDEGNENSAGYEDKMWEQTGDLYKWTMDLNMVRNPGEAGVYCSAGANLVAGVVAHAAKQHTPALFQKLIADPLGIKEYYHTIAPSKNEFTFTGGTKFLLRDFLKLAQVHLNGGTWKGKRIYSKEWSDRATSDLMRMGTKRSMYGYLWWLEDYPYRGRTVRAYFASGNGGQISMGIPDLGLAIAFFGGNYNSHNTSTAHRVYVPKYILPAVKDQ